jgi:hypothetical protein
MPHRDRKATFVRHCLDIFPKKSKKRIDKKEKIRYNNGCMVIGGVNRPL